MLFIFRALKGWTFGLAILLTALFGNYIICLFFPLLLIGLHRNWRHNMDRAVSFWMTIPMCFLEFFFGVRIRVSGDIIDIEEPSLIIMNHRTRLDWMYIWSALFQMNPWLITTNKISMKKELKMLPGAGFGMASNQFIFLERNLEKDKESFDRSIDYYKGMGMDYQILLFPEGTDKTDWTTAKSDSYAKKNGLTKLEYLLYPRITGFYHLITKMRHENYITHIYDVTIAYPFNVVQSEIQLILKGQSPREVHFHLKKIAISDIPKGEDELGEWITNLWLEKEEKLRRFYAEPRCSYRRFEENGQSWTNKKESWRRRLMKLSSSGVFLGVSFVWIYHLTFLRFLQIGFFYCILVQLITNWGYGGIDQFVIHLWKKTRKTTII